MVKIRYWWFCFCGRGGVAVQWQRWKIDRGRRILRVRVVLAVVERRCKAV